MEFDYTDHSEKRMIRKNIKKVWVEATIAKPDILLHNEDGTKKALKYVKQAKSTIGAVYTIENQKYVVITAYWG